MTPNPPAISSTAHRNKTSNRQVPVLVCMPQDLIDQLDAEAVRRGLDSRSKLVRRFCEAMLTATTAS